MYLAARDLSKALEHLQEALEIAVDVDAKHLLVYIHYGLAEVSLAAGELQKARAHADDGIQLAEELELKTEPDMGREIREKIDLTPMPE